LALVRLFSSVESLMISEGISSLESLATVFKLALERSLVGMSFNVSVQLTFIFESLTAIRKLTNKLFLLLALGRSSDVFSWLESEKLIIMMIVVVVVVMGILQELLRSLLLLVVVVLLLLLLE